MTEPNGPCLPAADREAREGFLELLPAVTAQVRRAFRGLTPDRREEAIQGSLGDAYAAYVGLCRRGLRSLAYPTPLARYAVRRFRAGRRLGVSLNTHDVLSPYRRQGHACQVETLFAAGADGWQETIVEDRRSGPAETAAVRVDFTEWLRRLPPHRRRLAKLLAGGEGTAAAARRFKLSRGRISQCRRELEISWRRFQGESAAI